MTSLKNNFKKWLNDESGQGTVEYVLVVVGVVALALLFRGKLIEIATSLMDSLQGEISGFLGG